MNLDEAVEKLVRTSEATAEAARAAEAAARDAQTAANGAKAAANATTSAVQGLTYSVKVLRRHVDTLWSRVIGGKPSMPPEGVDPATQPLEVWSETPLVTATTEATSEIDELRGQVLAVHAELREQSKAMGLGKKGLAFVFSKQGQREIVRTVGAVGALVSAIGAIGAWRHATAEDKQAAAPPAPAIVYMMPPALPPAIDAGHL